MGQSLLPFLHMWSENHYSCWTYHWQQQIQHGAQLHSYENGIRFLGLTRGTKIITYMPL